MVDGKTEKSELEPYNQTDLEDSDVDIMIDPEQEPFSISVWDGDEMVQEPTPSIYLDDMVWFARGYIKGEEKPCRDPSFDGLMNRLSEDINIGGGMLTIQVTTPDEVKVVEEAAEDFGLEVKGKNPHENGVTLYVFPDQ